MDASYLRHAARGRRTAAGLPWALPWKVSWPVSDVAAPIAFFRAALGETLGAIERVGCGGGGGGGDDNDGGGDDAASSCACEVAEMTLHLSSTRIAGNATAREEGAVADGKDGGGALVVEDRNAPLLVRFVQVSISECFSRAVVCRAVRSSSRPPG